MCHLNHSFLVNSLKWTITKEESIHTDRYNTNVSIACVGLIVPNPPPKKNSNNNNDNVGNEQLKRDVQKIVVYTICIYSAMKAFIKWCDTIEIEARRCLPHVCTILCLAEEIESEGSHSTNSKPTFN